MLDSSAKRKNVFCINSFLFGLIIGLLVSSFILNWAKSHVDDLNDQYTMILIASNGNLESDVERRLGKPDIIFKNKNNLGVDGYTPTPKVREMDKIVGYKKGKYLTYVFYKDDKVQLTFVSKGEGSD